MGSRRWAADNPSAIGTRDTGTIAHEVGVFLKDKGAKVGEAHLLGIGMGYVVRIVVGYNVGHETMGKWAVGNIVAQSPLPIGSRRKACQLMPWSLCSRTQKNQIPLRIENPSVAVSGTGLGAWGSAAPRTLQRATGNGQRATHLARMLQSRVPPQSREVALPPQLIHGNFSLGIQKFKTNLCVCVCVCVCVWDILPTCSPNLCPLQPPPPPLLSGSQNVPTWAESPI